MTRPKPLALLAYLALEGAKSRGHVRDLFWGNLGDAAANLRMALKQLRTAGALLEKSDSLACAVPSDAEDLLKALDAGHDQKAVALYTGAFLQGLDLGLPEFEEWLLTTGEYLAARVSLAHLRLAEAALASRDLIVAAQAAQAAYSVEGNSTLEPDVLLRVLRVLELSHSDLAVLVRREALELGLRIPNFKTTANSLPVPLHRFIERSEQALLLEYLQDNRLITIVGYGGAGKSRLALEVARELQTAFEVCFVPLEAVIGASGVAEACLRALGEEIKATPLEGLKHRLGQEKTLLVLDNFEHLLEFAPSLLELLNACSGLQVLITSRERLNVLGETVLPLSGFDSDTVALEFFTFCALRSGIQIKASDLAALEICTLLECYPLALELAAALTPVLSLPEMLSALQEHLDILGATPWQTGRHNGMRAVFNWSWSLLTNQQRFALARLAVFKDGFARTAALTVIDSNLTMLIALLQKSLVQNQHNGRYRLHPLIAQYCLEALEAIPLETNKAKSHHAHFFLNWLEQNAADVRSDKAGGVLSAFETDLENCKSAWLWLCAHPDSARFERLQDVVLLFDARARFSEGIRLFETAIAALEPKMALAQSASSRDEILLRGMAILRINAAWLYTRINNSQTSLMHASQADKLLESLVETESNLKVLNILGTAANNLSKYDLALYYYERAVITAQKLHLKTREAMARQNSGNVYSSLGQYEKAIVEFHKAREVYIILDEKQNLIHLNMNILHLMIFCIPSAANEIQKLLNESIEMALYLNEINVAQWFYIYAIFEYTDDNQLERAKEIKEFYQKNYSQVENIKDAFFRIALAKLDVKSNHLEEAKKNLFMAIELSKKTPNNDTFGYAILCLARIFIAQNNENDAVSILRYLIKQSSLKHWLQKELIFTLENCDDSINSKLQNQEPSQLVWLN